MTLASHKAVNCCVQLLGMFLIVGLCTISVMYKWSVASQEK